MNFKLIVAISSAIVISVSATSLTAENSASATATSAPLATGTPVVTSGSYLPSIQNCNQAVISLVGKAGQWYMIGVGRESGCTISGLKANGASLVYKWNGDINNYDTADGISNFQGCWIKK